MIIYHIPFVGDSEIGLDKISLPVEIMVCDGMAYVGVNIDDTYELVTNEKSAKSLKSSFPTLKSH